MSTEQNKAVANRVPLEFNKKNLAILDEVVAPNAVEHAAPPGMPPTIESTKQSVQALLAAFPDLKYSIDDAIAEGDKVVQRITAHGTMKGEFMGMPATGKQASWTEIHIVRLTNGKIVEHWGIVDSLGMMEQLGVIPMLEQAK